MARHKGRPGTSPSRRTGPLALTVCVTRLSTIGAEPRTASPRRGECGDDPDGQLTGDTTPGAPIPYRAPYMHGRASQLQAHTFSQGPDGGGGP
jgi:hypothetical protein